MKTAKHILFYVAILFLIVACGGGSESLTRDEPDSGGDVITPETYSISVTLVDMQGVTATTVADASPLTIEATVTNSSGSAQAGQVVSFVLSQDELADFSNDTGTALTNADGVATIQLSVGSLSGSGTITVSVEQADSVVIGFASSGTQQAVPSILELFASSTQLASSGAGNGIELIAVVKNEQNILLPNIPVSFSANANASITMIDSVTQADGTARARLTTENNKENRTITVNASAAATAPQSLDVFVVGTEININGSNSVIINDDAPITIVLSDSDGNGIANQPVVLTTNNGTLDNNNPQTGANGQVTVNYSSNQAGPDVITATALSVTRTFDVMVQQDDFSFNGLPTEPLDLNTDQTIRLRWFKDSLAYAGGTVVVTTSRGTISGGNVTANSATTDASGIATITINSQFAGPASLSAVGTDADGNEVTARTELVFLADTVETVFVDATPDSIGPEGQTSTITAVLRDAIGNLVQGKTVNFTLISDASGGSISPNTAITDSNGIASTVYTSNAISGDNGVTIGAQSDGVSNSVDLTVGDRAFDIVLGTGNEIEEEDQTTYTKEFAVFVTDASGRPVANASLSAGVVPTLQNAYTKGEWLWNEDDDIYFSLASVFCQNEDVNQDGLLDFGEDINSNGILDPGEDLNNDGMLDIGEDTNGDGLLTPGNVATVAFKDNDSTTNEFGQATLQVRYPQQYAVWSRVKLTVSGQSSGTESKTTQEFYLSVAASDLTTQSASPPSNPFGSSANCNDTD